MIPDPIQQPMVPVWPVVGAALGKRRSAVLELARRGQLPVTVHRCQRRPTFDPLASVHR
jgi:hypothetical protein